MRKQSMIDPSLPLIDLHRHLDGSVRLETILDLGRQHHLPLPADDVEGLKPHVHIVDPQPGVMAFIAKFHWMTEVMVDLDACRRIAYENVEDLEQQGLDYAELRFSPWFMAEKHELDPRGVVEAVVDGVKTASQDLDLPVGIIGIISRTYGVDTAWDELGALASCADAICGLDLAGDEANFPAALFQDHFHRAKELGWSVTVHAGESSGPESIWDAIRLLGANRIGHAVSAIQDARLVDVMLEEGIGVEANLTSNIQTSTVDTYDAHPLRDLLEAGVLATINTDDPGISDIDLIYEYEIAAPAAGITPELAHQAQDNAVRVSFLSDEEKAALRRRKAA